MNPMKTAAVTTAYIFRHRANKTVLPVFIATLAAAAAVFFAVWMPAAMDRAKLESSVDSAMESIRKNESAIKFMEEYGSIKEYAGAAVKKLSHPGGAGAVSQKLNFLAASAGLKLSIENTGNKNESVAGYDVIIQDIVVSGTYRDVRAFVYGLENMDVLTALRKVRIDREGRKAGMVKCAVQFALYVKPEQKEAKE